MISKTFKSIISNLLSKGIIIPLGLINSIIINRYLGPSGKGQYFFLIILITSFVPLILFGFNNSIHYYIASKKLKINEIFYSSIIINILFSLLAILIIFNLYSFNMLGETTSSVDSHIFYLTLLIIPFNFLISLFNAFLNSKLEYHTINKINIVTLIIFLSSNYLLLVVYNLGLIGAIISYLLQLFFRFILTIWFIRKIFSVHLLISLDVKKIKEIFTYGSKLWINSVFNLANTKLDSFVLGFLLSANNLGLYSVGLGLVNYMNMIPNSFLNVLFTKMSGENKKRALILRNYQHKILVIYTIPILLFFYFFSEKIIYLLYGEDFVSSANVTKMLSLGMAIYLLARPILKYFGSIGKPLKNTFSQLMGVIISVPLYFILIPKYNVMGAAITSTIGYFVTYVIVLCMIKDSTNIKSLYFFNKEDRFTIKNYFKNVWIHRSSRK